MDKENKKPSVVIEATDKYGDVLKADMTQHESRRKPVGYVEIYEVDKDGNKQLNGKCNLVVYQGREWIAQRLFAVNNASVTATTHDQFISWFGVGSGGADVGDPLNPDAPENTETDLLSATLINSSDANCSDDGYYHPFDSDTIEFEQDVDTDSRWLKAKISVTLGTDDANLLDTGDSLINEAGLFLASSKADGFAGPFKLFARVTFASIVKDSSRSLLFIWYVYV